MIELHGQHEHQTLLDPSIHLGVLDTFGGLHAFVAPTEAAFQALRAASEDLARVRQLAAEAGVRQELAAFQLAELEKAALKSPAPGDPEEDVELQSAQAGARERRAD